MYRAFFEYQESMESRLYENFISKITNNKLIKTPHISISQEPDIPRGFVKITIQLDILEDFTYELKSSFESYKDVLSNVSAYAGNIISFFDKLNQLNATQQVTSQSVDLMKTQVWKETEPFRMNFKFSLQTKTNPFIDVYLPAILLCSQTILSPIKGNEKILRTPGVNRNKIPDTSNNKTTTVSAKDRNASSKLLDTFAILVRNIDFGETKSNPVYSDTEYRSNESFLGDYNSLIAVDYAFIETAKPTWSKERTESGVPLWCELELTVQSVFSANDAMFSYIYPEADKKFFQGGATQLGKKVLNAGISKAVNIFR